MEFNPRNCSTILQRPPTTVYFAQPQAERKIFASRALQSPLLQCLLKSPLPWCGEIAVSIVHPPHCVSSAHQQRPPYSSLLPLLQRPLSLSSPRGENIALHPTKPHHTHIPPRTSHPTIPSVCPSHHPVAHLPIPSESPFPRPSSHPITLPPCTVSVFAKEVCSHASQLAWIPTHVHFTLTVCVRWKRCGEVVSVLLPCYILLSFQSRMEFPSFKG